MTDGQIAADLRIPAGTVKEDVASLIRKMGASSRTESAVLAIKGGAPAGLDLRRAS
jgi:DNA-binding NarL/FixJ family response regulator